MNQKTHGGKRAGAGRKSRLGVRKQQKTVRLHPEWISRLEAEFGSLQRAVEVLAFKHLQAS
jgi:hypothetical protein